MNFKKLHSADARVTGIVSITLYAIVAFGKQSCRFKSFRISTELILISLGLKSRRNINSTYSSLAAVSEFSSLVRAASKMISSSYYPITSMLQK